MKQKNRRIMPAARLGAYIILGALLLGCTGWLWLHRHRPFPETVKAEIWVDSSLYDSIDLSAAQNTVFSIEADTGKPVSFEVRDGAIRFVDVTCPDHICEKTGFVQWEGQTAVCMPNRTVLTISAESI